MLTSAFRRKEPLVQFCRATPKRNPDKRGFMKNNQRLANTARYTIENSENKDSHRWMNDKRIKAMARSIEAGLNRNRLTLKMDPKKGMDFVTKMKELEPRLYWEKMHHIETLNNYKRHYDQFFQQEVVQMPGSLKGEYEVALRNDEEAMTVNGGISEEFNPENLYWEQNMRLNAEEQAKLLALQSRVRKLMEGRLMEDE